MLHPLNLPCVPGFLFLFPPPSYSSSSQIINLVKKYVYIKKIYMWPTVKKSPYHPDPGSGRGGATVLYFLSFKTHTLIVPLLCLAAKLQLQGNLSHLSKGKEFPPSPWKRCLYTFCVSLILTVRLDFSYFCFRRATCLSHVGNFHPASLLPPLPNKC